MNHRHTRASCLVANVVAHFKKRCKEKPWNSEMNKPTVCGRNVIGENDEG